jgi:DNA-binding SARP family transcriptional activator
LSSETEFCLLGPLQVCSDGVVVPISQGKLRALLAALLLNANRPVSVDELAGALWGPDPPATARVGVQNYVMQLRRTLGNAGTRIVTQSHGYQIRVQDDELDVARFETLARDARAAVAAGNWPEAANHAAVALGLWRGEPLSDIDSDLLAARELPRLAELRLQALEIRIDADLRLGRHREVISELKQLVVAHPLRERLHGLLMLALYRDGRQGESLEAYQRARAILVDELGTEPGAELQGLHQQVLTADRALAAPAAGTGTSGVVPQELPAPVGHFTGRATELAALTRLIELSGGQSSTLVISAIGGTAGVGKTALAVHWAHRVADRFPDGQLYVNLRGYDPDQPMPAADALAGLLTSLGVPGQNIPAGVGERAARYRSLLAGKRALVLLDNAGSVEQVRPLLPGSPGCVVVVTSRDALAGLVAREGADRIDLDLLPMRESVSLLRALIGARVDADPAAAGVLAQRCARLPLALRVAAELAAVRPAAPLADLVDELADQQRRLDQLDADGDSRTAVRTVFSWSYLNLEAGPARAFRLAGLHPGADLEAYALAALTGRMLDEAHRDLDVLSRAHLVQPAGPDRYSMHDLLRAYAREIASTEDSEDEQRSALTRLFDYYLYTAATATDKLYPAYRHRRPRIPIPASPVPAFADAAAGLSWLDAEQVNLVAAATVGVGRGWPSYATRLAAILFRYLQDSSSRHEITLSATALRAAQDAGDDAAAAQALSGLGAANWRRGHLADAMDNFEQALALFRKTGDRTGQARALHNMGTVAHSQASYRRAAECSRSALNLFRQLRDRAGQAAALNAIGNALRRQGEHGEATDRYLESLELAREVGDRNGEGVALGNLANLANDQGRYPQAAEYHQCALALFRDTGNRNKIANVLSNLGVTVRLDGQYDAAVSYHMQAIALFRETRDRLDEASALNDLAETLLAAGRIADARAQLGTALDLAGQIDHRYQQARALRGLGDVHRATGCPAEARELWERALDLFAEVGANEAEQVRAQLAEAAAALTANSATPSGSPPN